MFTDNMPVSDEIKNVCGIDRFCISDMLLTDKKEFSLHTKRVNAVNTDNKVNIGKWGVLYYIRQSLTHSFVYLNQSGPVRCVLCTATSSYRCDSIWIFEACLRLGAPIIYFSRRTQNRSAQLGLAMCVQWHILIWSVFYILEKEIPTIVGPSVMHVTIGRPTSIRIYSNNTGTSVTLTADFDMPDGATFDASTGTFTWNPPSYVTSPVNIT